MFGIILTTSIFKKNMYSQNKFVNILWMIVILPAMLLLDYSFYYMVYMWGQDKFGLAAGNLKYMYLCSSYVMMFGIFVLDILGAIYGVKHNKNK